MGILDKIVSALGTGPKTYHILVVGLDNSGKSTMINFLKAENVRVAGEIPPTFGVQVSRISTDYDSPTATKMFFVKIEKIKYKNCVLLLHDMSGQGKYRAIWERCFLDCQAIIFVVDISDRYRIT